jgi:uncharacterized protein (DUF302 family)
MSYYFAKTLRLPFAEAVQRVTDELAAAGFGVLTEIDVQKTLEVKLGVEFPPYRILGACNPQLAHRALQAEDKIGTMLPCNVILQQTDEGVEVAAVDPAASMQAVDNPDLADIAQQVRGLLQGVIEKL